MNLGDADYNRVSVSDGNLNQRFNEVTISVNYICQFTSDKNFMPHKFKGKIFVYISL